MARQIKRPRRRARPELEGLETRQLLSGGKIRLASNGARVSDDELKRAILQLQQNVPVKERRIAYTTPEGVKVVVSLYGRGTMKGTTVRPDGALDLVFNNTDNNTRIIGAVQGAHGRRAVVPLAGIRDSDTTPRSNSSTGVNPIAAVQLRDFHLLDEGFINLTGGILQLNLNSAGKRASVYLTQGTPPETVVQTGTIIATGGASVGGVTPVQSETVAAPTTAAGVEGIEIRINRIDAGPLGAPPFGNPQVYSVDPAGSQLIRFDTKTGEPTLAVPLPALGTTRPSVGLAMVDTRLLVLVGNISEILAFDAVTGSPVGSFSTANLAGLGFADVDGIGGSTTRALITSNGGVGVHVDVAASLATGQAEARGAPFVPTREFVLNGGATGLAGSNVIVANGAAHFDSFQPNLFQFGTITLAPFGQSFREQARTAALNAFGGFRNAGPDGLDTSPFFGLGSINTSLAQLVEHDAATGKNVIRLYTPGSTAIAGTVLLNHAAQLAGLSESLHPEIQQATLIDINGSLKRFIGKEIHGLVLNSRGLVNFVAIHTATNSAIIGRPLNHLEFVRKENVQLISSARGFNGKIRRNDVTVIRNYPPQGPLVIP